MSSSVRLRVVHVAEDISEIAGGVPAVVRQLSDRMARRGISVQVAHATGDPGELKVMAEVFTYPPTALGRSWSWGYGLRSGVARLVNSARGDHSVVHIHGVWAAPQYFAARYAQAAGVPFVVTAHGMLEPWLWNQQGWKIHCKKRVYWFALGYPALSKATVIHAITPRERNHLKKLFPGTRIEVIPNAIDMDKIGASPSGERCKSILFLSRIEPKKGVDVLLRAFAQARISKEWSVDIVGPVWSQAYLSRLESIVDEFGLTKRVRFHGPLFGEQKSKLIDSAWVMVAPSHSEVVGLVNLEAAARCLPTITTHQTGLHDWESGGGILIDPSDNSLRKALAEACSWSEQEHRSRGEASRNLVQQRYSWQVVLPLWMQLYTSL